ncbi:MAG TPA: hypothetical protein VJZ72_00680 [Candidatus Limnocylindrales bacterium]|nr:hypothetical protein [Candidatus Limnocylindrales bacterium]
MMANRDRDLEVAPGRVEGDRDPVLVGEAEPGADDEDETEHREEEDRHRDGHLQDDLRLLEDEVALQREHDDEREEQSDDRECIESRPHALHRGLAAPPHDEPAGEHSGDERQP